MKESLYKKYLRNIKNGKTAIRKEYVEKGYFSYYSKREINNHLNSKRIIIDGVNGYFDEFVNDTLNKIENEDKMTYLEIYLGKIGKNLSEKVQKANRNEKDIEGYNITISINEIIHTLNEHGTSMEKLRGQKILKGGEIKLLPYLLINIDKVKYLGKNKNKQNVYNLISINNDGTYNLLQFINNNRHNFGFQSLFINQTKQQKRFIP